MGIHKIDKRISKERPKATAVNSGTCSPTLSNGLGTVNNQILHGIHATVPILKVAVHGVYGSPTIGITPVGGEPPESVEHGVKIFELSEKAWDIISDWWKDHHGKGE